MKFLAHYLANPDDVVEFDCASQDAANVIAEEHKLSTPRCVVLVGKHKDQNVAVEQAKAMIDKEGIKYVQ